MPTAGLGKDSQAVKIAEVLWYSETLTRTQQLTVTGPSSAKAAGEELGSHMDCRVQLLSDTFVYGTACNVFLAKH